MQKVLSYCLGYYWRLSSSELSKESNLMDMVVHIAGLSVRAGGGGFLPAIRVWCAGYEHMHIVDSDLRCRDMRTTAPPEMSSEQSNNLDNPAPFAFLGINMYEHIDI